MPPGVLEAARRGGASGGSGGAAIAAPRVGSSLVSAVLQRELGMSVPQFTARIKAGACRSLQCTVLQKIPAAVGRIELVAAAPVDDDKGVTVVVAYNNMNDGVKVRISASAVTAEPDYEYIRDFNGAATGMAFQAPSAGAGGCGGAGAGAGDDDTARMRTPAAAYSFLGKGAHNGGMRVFLHRGRTTASSTALVRHGDSWSADWLGPHRLLLCASANRPCAVHSVQRAPGNRDVAVSENPVNTITFSSDAFCSALHPDSYQAAETAAADGPVTALLGLRPGQMFTWDTRSKAIACVAKLPTSLVNLRTLPGRHTVVAADADKTLCLYDCRNWREPVIPAVAEYCNNPKRLRVDVADYDGTLLVAAACADRCVRLWCLDPFHGGSAAAGGGGSDDSADIAAGGLLWRSDPQPESAPPLSVALIPRAYSPVILAACSEEFVVYHGLLGRRGETAPAAVAAALAAGDPEAVSWSEGRKLLLRSHRSASYKLDQLLHWNSYGTGGGWREDLRQAAADEDAQYV